MPTGIVLIPLLAGYILLHICYLSRFRAQRQDGYRLLIESALTGLPISLLAWKLAAIIHSRGWDFLGVEELCRQTPVPYLGTALLSAAIASVAGVAANLIFPPELAQWYLIERDDDGYLRLLHRAARKEKPVSVTLKSKKVYIGFVIQTPSLRRGEQYVSVLPLASGYRKSDSLDLVLTQDYTRVYDKEGFDPSEFAVVFPLSQIESANLFEPSAYPLFGVEPEQAPDAARAAAIGRE